MRVDTSDDAVTTLADKAVPAASIPEEHTPQWLDYDAVAADLADDGVAAPEPYVDGLRTVVADAADQGLDLKVVFTEEPAAVYTDARDVATMLNQEYDGTILVRTPAFVGSSSDTIPRHQLEAGQDDASHESDPVLSATVFVHKATAPGLPWGAMSATVLVLIIVAVVAFLVAVRRRNH